MRLDQMEYGMVALQGHLSVSLTLSQVHQPNKAIPPKIAYIVGRAILADWHRATHIILGRDRT